jgi:S1-C subfamily serine protease
MRLLDSKENLTTVWIKAALIGLFALGTNAPPAHGQVPGNVIGRVFEIRFDGGVGTGFIADYEDRQYIITANHVVASAGSRAEIEFRAPADSQWHRLKVSILHGSDACADVAVLIPSVSKLTDAETVLIGNASNYAISQEAYFLGFPYGLYTSFADSTQAGPLIKHAYVSAVVSCAAVEPGGSSKDRLILLDGLNNPGFSGGPVVAPDIFAPNHPFKFIGIVRGYRPENVPVTTNGQPDLTSTVATNTGIVVVIPMDRAIDLIRKSNKTSGRP